LPRMACRGDNRDMSEEHADDQQLADEAELVAAAKRDSAEFGPLYERYVDQIYRFAYRRTGNHADAEDVTAQTFQQALAALPSYEWRGLPFGAWLYRIASNIIYRRGRTSSREVSVEDVSVFARSEESQGEDPAELIGAQSDADDLLAAIRTLPEDQQRALVLKFSRGLRNREIGDAMGRSEGAIKQLVHRAMINLRATLERDNVSGA
jgi:RNA polymerase sigma-70 factor, ECF subfamily